MPRFRLKSAHHLWNEDFKAPALVNGDMENEHMGDEKGTVVGTGTPWRVDSATIEMVPLDAEAEAMLAAEEERLARNNATMNPIERLPMTAGDVRDDYDDRFIPGFPGKPRPQAKAASVGGGRSELRPERSDQGS